MTRCARLAGRAWRCGVIVSEAEHLAHILMRCRTVLGNMALKNETGLSSIFNRWPISHEPLRSDAKNLVPLIDEALSAYHQSVMSALSSQHSENPSRE